MIIIPQGITHQNTVRCFFIQKKKKSFYSVHLFEMWFLVYIGLMLPFSMNEIPFALNIMSISVHTASRLVESLAPVKKKTWTGPSSQLDGAGTHKNIYLILCLSQNAAIHCRCPPMPGVSLVSITAGIFFCFFFNLFWFWPIFCLRTCLAEHLYNKKRQWGKTWIKKCWDVLIPIIVQFVFKE